MAANKEEGILKLPKFTWNKSVCFLDLRLIDESGKEIDNNFYWLSYKNDVLDYKADVQPWYYYTPSKQYADFTALNSMPKVDIKASMNRVKGRNNKVLFKVKLVNNSDKIAFFINTKMVDKKSGNSILPVLWSDNYVSLLPGETRVLTATVNKTDLKNITPELVLEGFNE